MAFYSQGSQSWAGSLEIPAVPPWWRYNTTMSICLQSSRLRTSPTGKGTNSRTQGTAKSGYSEGDKGSHASGLITWWSHSSRKCCSGWVPSRRCSVNMSLSPACIIPVGILCFSLMASVGFCGVSKENHHLMVTWHCSLPVSSFRGGGCCHVCCQCAGGVAEMATRLYLFFLALQVLLDGFFREEKRMLRPWNCQIQP